MIFGALAGIAANALGKVITGGGGQKESASVNKDETTNSSKTTDQQKTGTTSQTSSSSGSSSGSSNQVTQNEQNLTNKSFNQGLIQGNQTGTTSLLNDTALGLLQGNLDASSKGSAQGIADLMALATAAKDNVGSFDTQGFVNAALARGEQDFIDTVKPQLRSFASNTGGTAETNSMAAILNMQAQDRFAVNQNDIASKASLTANQMELEKMAQAISAATGLTQSSIPFADILKGAVQTSDVVNSQSSTNEGGSTQQGVQTGSSNTTTQQQQQQQTEALVQELMQILMNEKGTSTTKTNQDTTGQVDKSKGPIQGISDIIGVLGQVKNFNQVASVD